MGEKHQRGSKLQKWANKSTPLCLGMALSRQHYYFFLASDFDDGDAAVELSLVESEAQAQRLSERGGEGVEVGQIVRLSHLRECDGAGTVVHGDANSVASHLVREAGLPAVVPGGQLPVVLLCQAPRYLDI